MGKDSFFFYRILARLIFCGLALKAVFAGERGFFFLAVLLVIYVLVEFGISAVSKWKHVAEERSRELEARHRAEVESKRQAMEFHAAQRNASQKYFNPTGLYQKKVQPEE